MQCERLREYYSDYLERTLDAATTATVRTHLTTCAACEREVAALGDTFSMLSAMPLAEPPARGEWEVLRRVQEARRKEEAAAPSIPLFLQWLRSLNPLSLGVGAGLATLVIAGATFVSNVPHSPMGFTLPGVGAGVQQPAQTPGSVAPQLAVIYRERTADGEIVALRLTAASDIPDATITVEGNSGWSIPTGRLLTRGTVLDVPLVLPVAAGAEVLRVNVNSASLGKQFRYLVAVPLGERHEQRVTLAFGYQSLEATLRQLAPSLGRPVVVQGNTDATVQLAIQDRPARIALEAIAEQMGTILAADEGAYRIAAR